MERKNKKNDSENKGESSDTIFDSNLLTRFLGPIKILIRMHLKIASEELKTDLKRYIFGMTFLLIGIFFMLMLWVLTNVIIILLIKNNFIPDLFFSVLITAAANLLISLFMLIMAGAKFKRPFLKETKKVLKETLNDLK